MLVPEDDSPPSITASVKQRLKRAVFKANILSIFKKSIKDPHKDVPIPSYFPF